MYASPACRTRAFRQRHATDELLPLPDVIRDAPVSVAGRSTDLQVQQAVVETRTLAFTLLRLGIEARPELAWRCTRMGEAIQQALEDHFGRITS